MANARLLGDEILFLCKRKSIERACVAHFFDRPQSPLIPAFANGDLLW